MYRIEDKALAIREVQRFLLIISQTEDALPQSPVDGIYGEETREAVKVFQRINSLDETGAVDKFTFDLLFLIATNILAQLDASNKVMQNEKFPLRIGQSGNDVANLNSLLNELSAYYELGEILNSDFFSRETEYAVKKIQEQLRMEITGTVTELLLEKLRTEAGARKNFRRAL